MIPFRQCCGHFRIGNAAKGHEQPADREPRLPSVGIFQQKVFQLSVIGVEIGDDRIRQDGKIFPLGRLLHQCLLRPEGFSPVDQCHAAAASGQKQSILKGGVAAAGHCYVLSVKERAIAQGAIADAAAYQCFFTGQPQRPGLRSGGIDHRPGRHRPVLRFQKERAVRVSFDPLYPAEGQLRPGRFRLGIHPVPQFHAADRAKAGIILHQRREGDLPAEAAALEYGNGASRPCGIQGGCQSGGTAADHSKLDHWAYSRRNALIWAAPT